MAVLDHSSADDILTSTLDEMRDGLQEQWLTGNPVTKEMRKAGNVETQEGGNQIVVDIEYQDNDTFAWVDQDTPFSTAINQILKRAQYYWAVCGGTVGIGDHDEAKNTGSHAKHKLWETRMKNLKNTFTENFETALVAAVTPAATQIWSLLDVVDSGNPTIANFGAIDRGTYTWWGATETTSGSFATQGLEDMRTAFFTTGRAQTDPVSMLITTQTVFEYYLARLTPYERLAKIADLEFTHVTFAGKPLFFSEDMASGLMLGINTKYLKLYINSAMNFKNQPFVREPGGQYKSAVVQTMCQMVGTRNASHFKLSSISA